MQQEGVVVLIDAVKGRFGFRAGSGSYGLAEQLDAALVKVGAPLSGNMDTIGFETFTDTSLSTKFTVFIVAYGLSFDAMEEELLN